MQLSTPERKKKKGREKGEKQKGNEKTSFFNHEKAFVEETRNQIKQKEKGEKRKKKQRRKRRKKGNGLFHLLSFSPFLSGSPTKRIETHSAKTSDSPTKKGSSHHKKDHSCDSVSHKKGSSSKIDKTEGGHSSRTELKPQGKKKKKLSKKVSK